MKKIAYHCNINEYICFCVENKKAFFLFTPKEIGKETALVDKEKKDGEKIKIPTYWKTLEIETGGNFQLDDDAKNIVLING